MIFAPSSTTSKVVAYTGTAATLTGAMATPGFYRVVATSACWLKQGTTPTAAVPNTDGNIYLPANVEIHLSAINGPDVSVIQDTAAGKLVVSGLLTF